MKNYKQFKLEKKGEYIICLKDLLVNIRSGINGYQKYLDRLQILMQNHLTSNNADRRILSEEYEDIRVGLTYFSRVLIKLIVDEQKVSYSYKKVRERIEKYNIVDVVPLSEDIKKDLNDLLQIRHATFHNVESNLHAMLEAYKKQLPEPLQLGANYNLGNIIDIEHPKYIDILVVYSSFEHHSKREELYIKIHNLLLDDLESLLGKRVIINESITDEVFTMESPHVLAAQINMSMQKRKYTEELSVENLFK